MKETKLNIAAVGALAKGDIENFIVAATPGGIEAQEAAGQRSFVANSTLPKEMLHCTKEQLEKIGIIFGESADDLFYNVTLPEGWKKQPTSHSMWSDLLDEKGRKRASIFYKAAFYDRKAHISIESRFHITSQPTDAQGNAVSYEDDDYRDRATHLRQIVTDALAGEPIFTGNGIVERRDHPKKDALYAECKAWLDDAYPNWEDATEYWD